MLRRSPRFVSSGYYNSEENPTISYKEVVYKVFKRRRQRKIRMEERQDWSCDSERRGRRKGLTTLFRKMFGLLLVLLFPLCFSLTLFSMLGQKNPGPAITQTDTNSTTKGMINKPSEQQDELRKNLSNFALESLGAHVVLEKSSKSFQVQEAGLSFFGIPVRRPPKSPRTVIQGNSPQVPGRCWAFAGGRGHLFISLSHPASISHVTLGHIPRSMSPTGSISSAPKLFSVYGMENLESEETRLGTFSYYQDGNSLQTFKVLDHKKGFNHVKLQVESNWGHPEYTCLYSFEVHAGLFTYFCKR